MGAENLHPPEESNLTHPPVMSGDFQFAKEQGKHSSLPLSLADGHSLYKPSTCVYTLERMNALSYLKDRVQQKLQRIGTIRHVHVEAMQVGTLHSFCADLLTQNFRSREPTVTHSLNVIVRNPACFEKDLFTQRGPGSDVLLVYEHSVGEEAVVLADLLVNLFTFLGATKRWGDVHVAMNGRLPTRRRRDHYEGPHELCARGPPEVEDPHLVDERKLFYVAATCACELLILSTADVVNKCGGGPSPFLVEMLGEDRHTATDLSRALVTEIESRSATSAGPARTKPFWWRTGMGKLRSSR